MALWQYSRAIKTYYNDIKYKSQLEANWAKRFDSLGIKFIYEPKTFSFELYPGWGDKPVKYTPDFWLIAKNCYVELKFRTASDTQVGLQKCLSLSRLGITTMLLMSTHKLKNQVWVFKNGEQALSHINPLVFDEAYRALPNEP